MATTTPGTLSMNVGGQKWIATPTSSTTAAQTAAATKAGWSSVPTGTSYTATGPSVQGGQKLPVSGPTTPEVAPKIEVGKLESPTAPTTPTYQPDLSTPDAFTQSVPITEIKPLTPEEQKSADLNTAIEKKWQEYQGMGEDYKSMQKQYQVPQNLQKLQETQAMIMQLQKNFAATNAQLAGQTIPSQIILKQQEVNRSAAAAEIGAYSAYAQALQGNVEMANNLIKQTLDIKYKPMKDRIDYMIQQGESLKASMDKKDQKEWELTKMNLQHQLDTASADKEFRYNLAETAFKSGMGQYVNDIVNGTGDKFNTAITAVQNNTSPDAPLYAGLSAQTATAVRGAVSQFKSEPVITNFNQIQSGYNFTKTLSDKTTNPADDQALIYSLAKVLDPGSVVREGEYATAQKYSQSWVNAYGKSITQAIAGTGFLSETARKNIKDTIESRYNASKTEYINLRDSYSGRIDALTGRQDGSAFLVDYAMPEEQDVMDQSMVVTPEEESLFNDILGTTQTQITNPVGDQSVAPSRLPNSPFFNWFK
jgi:hypothetical protein